MATAAARKPKQDNSYDAVLYESYSYPQTQPQHLHMVGTLFGLNPPDFRKARVLEIGCASGGNLFPVALAYPGSQCTGLDLSEEQVALANAHREALGLTNVNFLQQDILAFDLKKNAGKFDYIVCHGVFSWVPAPVRQRILELCRACLSPDGLAVVSYNTLPGWNAVRSLRDMMLYHTRRFADPAEKIRQSRALLEFLLESVPTAQSGYRATIEEELKLLKKTNDSYLFHDHLEDTNSQFYFNEFAEMLDANDLAYVGDTAVSSMFVENMPKQAVEKLKAVNNIVRQEQYMDFIVNRRFRSSVLCRRDRVPNRALKPAQILDFALSTSLKPEQPAPDTSRPVSFKTANGLGFTSHSETASTLYLTLAESGKHPIAARELVKAVQKKLKLKSPETIEAVLTEAGLQLALRGFILLHSDTPEFVTALSKKPETWPLARYQAGLKNCTSLTNRLGGTVASDMFANLCLQLADGTRTVNDIADAIAQQALSGEINVHRAGNKLTGEKDIRAELAEKVPVTLEKCAQQALMVA